MKYAPFGVPLRFHWSVLLLLALFVIQMGVMGFLFFTLLSLSVLFHEYAHVWVGKRCGLEVKEVVYFGLGAGAIMENLGEPKTELKVALAGPISSLVLALMVIPIVYINPGIIAFFYLFSMNVILAVFNALPIYPMDGGRILYAVLTFFTRKSKALNITVIISNVLSVIAIVLCVIYQQWYMIVMFIFLLLASKAAKRRPDIES